MMLLSGNPYTYRYYKSVPTYGMRTVCVHMGMHASARVYGMRASARAYGMRAVYVHMGMRASVHTYGDAR